MRLKGKKAIFNTKDTWDLDSTLSPIICAGLKKFKEVISDKKQNSSVGVPCNLLIDSGLDPQNDEDVDKGFELWLETLDKMIYSFEDIEPDLDDYSVSFVYDKEDIDSGFSWKNLRPSDEVAYADFRGAEDKHAAKVQEGLELFARYFKNLWW